MSGMLYKDFVAVKGKKILIILLAATLLFIALRFALPGSDFRAAPAGSVVPEDGFGDFFLWSFNLLIVVYSLFLPSVFIKGIIAQDEKNKVRSFTKALPFKKNTYIASKYVFLAVTVYAAFSLSFIWCDIYYSRAGDNNITDLVRTLQSFLIILASISLFVTGVELPFFLCLGSKKAVGVKTVIFELLFLLVLGWFFFGDLDVFAKIDLFAFIEWTGRHEFEINVMIVLCPVIASVLYFLSYKLTCALSKNREVDVDG